MTKLGLYLAKRSVNKAEVARKTGISTSRLSELSLNETAKLRADELYLIALAIDVDPAEVLKSVCGHLKLEK
jgi:DNA-binding Xre family transcriptional regulator